MNTFIKIASLVIAIVVIFDALRVNISEYGNVFNFNKKQDAQTEVTLAKGAVADVSQVYNR